MPAASCCCISSSTALLQLTSEPRCHAAYLALHTLPTPQRCRLAGRICAHSSQTPPRRNETLQSINAVCNEEVEYRDSLTDIAFIALCRKAYGSLAGWQSERSWRDGGETYQGMVEVSKRLMQGKTADEQRHAVIAGFPAVPSWFRRVFPYSKWGAELNAKITPAFFTWLVGPMETTDVEIGGAKQKSGVHIKKCRYLAESGCKGMCVNLCKLPVQTFFTEELGMPLTMKPNFEELSCDMVFGERPPIIAADEVMQQGCFAECSQAQPDSVRRCHKMQ